MSLYLGTNLISGTIQDTYTKSQVDSFLGNKADTDLSNLTATGKAKLGPTIYSSVGVLFNSGSDPCEGRGIATVLLFKNGLAEIHFNIKITTSGTSGTIFAFGINRDLLTYNNNDIPQITPIFGGSLTYYATNGTVADSKMEYGGTLGYSDQFWTIGRIYNTSGYFGSWPASELVAGQRLIGVCYGTYTP